MNSAKPTVSIIILAYKSKEHLQVLLPSIWASKCNFIFEVIVVDNDSKDGTLEHIKHQIEELRNPYPAFQLQLIENVNNGFAAGNNIGIKQAKGEYILLLNPDTKIQPDTLEVMVEFMERRRDVGMATCKIIKPDGSLDRAARRNFPNPWNAFLRFTKLTGLSKNKNSTYNISDSTADQEMEIDSLVGAFLLTTRNVIEKIGLLDEAFFMYGEDIDWCWRCKQAGYKVWYYPKTFITHYKGESSKKTPFRALKWFHEAMWTFYRKHYYTQYPKLFSAFVWLGIYTRLTALILLNAFRPNKRVSK